MHSKSDWLRSVKSESCELLATNDGIPRQAMSPVLEIRYAPTPRTTQPQETDVVFIGPRALMVFKDPFEGLAMTERRAIYGGDQALLAELPEALGPALHLIDKHGSTEAGAELVQMLASAADPDYICNLSTLAMLPSPYKEAALVAIEHVLSTGLDLSQQSRLLALLRPRLLRLGPGRL